MEPRERFGRGDFDRMMSPPYLIEHGHRHADHPLWWLFMFLLVALLVALVVWIVLWARARGGGPPQAVAAAEPVDDVLGIVRLRYARGEIDRKEFLRMLGDLGLDDLGARPEPPPAPSA